MPSIYPLPREKSKQLTVSTRKDVNHSLLPPPSDHYRSLATRRSLITTTTDRERSPEVGGEVVLKPALSLRGYVGLR